MGRKLADLWDYAERLNKRFKCRFCEKDFPGGVVRLRSHLSGVKGGGIQLCSKVSEEARNDALLSLNVVNKKRKAESSSSDSDGGSSEICDPSCNSEVGYSLAKFFLMAGINHNMVDSSSFTNLVKALSPSSALPSSLELESKLIPSFKTEVENYVSAAKQSWIETGCTLIPIFELNEKEGRSFLSVFGCSVERTVLLNTFEVPTNVDLVAPFLEETVRSVVQSVGSHNIVQCVVDGSECGDYFSSFLGSQFPHVSLTKCAAHEFQLLFEEICREVGWVGTTFTRIKSIVDYICSDTAILALMSKYTNGKELEQSLDLNFLSSYKMLESILEVKEDLVQLVQSPDWLASGYGAGQRGSEVTTYIKDSKTWDLGEKAQKGLRSLFQVLCLVDFNGSSSGSLYGLMEIVEHSISQLCNDNQDMYQRLWDIYKLKNGQMLSDFHIVAAFLNPAYMSTEQARTADMNPVINHILGRFIDAGDQDAFIKEVYEYRKMLSDGSKPYETKAAKIHHPCEWWESCGQRLSLLRNLAVRMLSQPCSTSSCKSSMSTAEAVQIKQQRGLMAGTKDLDLKFNAILIERVISTDKIYEREKIDLEEFSKQMSNNGSQGVFIEATCINGESTSSDMPLGMMDQPPSPKYQLYVRTVVPSTFTFERVKGEQRSPISVYLVDPATNTVVRDGAPSVLTLTVSVLDGNFNNEEFVDDQLSRDHFVNNELSSTGKPLVAGDLQVTLVHGQGNLGEFWFNYNSHETAESEQVMIGVKTETGYCEGIRILEGTSNAFFVEDNEVLGCEDLVSAFHIPEDTSSYMQGEIGYGSSCQLNDSDQASNVSMSGDLYDVIRWKSRAVGVGWAKVKAMIQWLLLWRAVQRKNEDNTGGVVLKAAKKHATQLIVVNQQEDSLRHKKDDVHVTLEESYSQEATSKYAQVSSEYDANPTSEEVETEECESMKIDRPNSSWKLTPLSLSIGEGMRHKEDNTWPVHDLGPKLFGVELTDRPKRKGTPIEKFSHWTSLRMGLENLVPPLDSTSTKNKKVSRAMQLPKDTTSCLEGKISHWLSSPIDKSDEAFNPFIKDGLCDDIRWNSKEAGIRWVKVKAMMWWTQVWRTVQSRRTQKQLLEHGTEADILKSTTMTVPPYCTTNQQVDGVCLKEDDMQMALKECFSKENLPLNITDIADAKGSLNPMSDTTVTSTHFPFQITTDGAGPTKEDVIPGQIEASELVKLNTTSSINYSTPDYYRRSLYSFKPRLSVVDFRSQKSINTENLSHFMRPSVEEFLLLQSTSSEGNKDTYYGTGATEVVTSSKRPSDDPDENVFLSFHRADTRRDFTSRFHEIMSRHGFKVIKNDAIDDPVRALENCKMRIVVLSRSYASSRQCLDELVMLLDKVKNIMPIFRGVTPDDVELKTNMYTDDLAGLETKYGKELVQKWREALKKVARIKGWEMKDNMSFVDLIEEVAREIQMKLKAKKKNKLQHFAEMEHHTKEDDMPAQLEACESVKMDSSEDSVSQLHSASSSEKNKDTYHRRSVTVVMSSSAPCYDLILRALGPDTRPGFTSHLYQSLSRQGIKVFRDDDILRTRGDPERAVENCKMSIVVLSRFYASSRYCLDELVMMLDKKKHIMPIYIGVTPDDVELKTNVYTDELAMHETIYGKELVQEWREALKKVARIKGWELKDNMSFVDLIEEVVQEIQMKLKIKKKNEVQHFVEMEHHTKEDDMPAQLEACESVKTDSSDVGQLHSASSSEKYKGPGSFLLDEEENIFGNDPEDQILYYLMQRIKEDFRDLANSRASIFPDFDYCQFEPWDIPKQIESSTMMGMPAKCGWYFFCPGKRNMSRTNPEVGFWKLAETGVISDDTGKIIGTKEIYCFNQSILGSSSNENQSWILHEYHLNPSCIGYKDSEQMPFVACCLKRIADKDPL